MSWRGMNWGDMRLGAALAVLFLLFAAPAGAVQPDEVLDDPVLEARARALSAGLRCLVCQNQSIDDSNAPLARDLRLLVRERLVAGDTDTQVIDYMVDRYGEFVLLKPRLSSQTLILWLAPPALFLLGGVVVFGVFRRRKRAPGEVVLSDGEEARLAELMVTKGKE
ncbi:Cytochrome c heme lyase subunit CcmL [hydrothermal vent metagenome]|uniref:Cytochrome c heme lyase subunit CcmL n=1 Tax=hydrothermal vent metagenome TaxID=652676 RepID=A0A3B0TNH5_9ZZZZ